MEIANNTILSQRYQILRHIGSGGLGDTYLAKDINLPSNPDCVVKYLKKNPDPDALEIASALFKKEGAILEKLGKFNQIPTLLAYIEEDSEFYLVQEYIDGIDLYTEIEFGNRWTEDKVLGFFKDILEILMFVHEDHQVIHRDISAKNIMRRSHDNKIVLIDFGNVKQISGKLVITDCGKKTLTTIFCTEGYAPKEQLDGNPKFCSDLYAVGMVVIYALTGIAPDKLAKEGIDWEEEVVISRGLKGFLEKMVHLDFKKRYQSASDALKNLPDAKTISANVSPLPSELITEKPKAKISNYFWIGITLFVMVAIGVISLGFILPKSRSITFPDGSFYEGDIINGLPNGQGILRFSDGDLNRDRYEGAFNLGKRTGKGKIFLRSGNLYEGDFVDDKFNGKGIYKFASGDVYTGDFNNDKSNGKGSIKYFSGDSYSGEFINGKLDGQGVFITTKGDRYEGEWKNGVKEGQFKVSYKNGDSYDGKFVNDKQNGKGVFKYLSGEIQDGEFLDGKFITGRLVLKLDNGEIYDGESFNSQANGKGVYTYPNGSLYKGEFLNGKFNGEGILIYGEQSTKSGEIYKGEFRNGEFHGRGIYKYPDSKEKKGVWENGTLVKQE